MDEAGVVLLYPVRVLQFIVELPRMRVPTPIIIMRPIKPPISGIRELTIESKTKKELFNFEDFLEIENYLILLGSFHKYCIQESTDADK